MIRLLPALLSVLMSLFLISTVQADEIQYPSPEAAKNRLEKLLPIGKNTGDSMILTETGICYHSLGAAGDAEAVIKAAEYFQKALNLQPGNNEIRAWLGSATVMKARDAWMMDKMTFSRKGMNLLDSAVAAEPENLAIRVIRGNSYLNPPSFLGKDQAAIGDFEFALGKIKVRNPLNIEQAQEVQYKVGLAYKKVNDGARAKENFTAAAALAPETELARQIQREELKK